MLWDMGPKLPVYVRVSGVIQMEITQRLAEDGADQRRYQTVLHIKIPVRASISVQHWEKSIEMERILDDTVLIRSHTQEQ